MANIQRGAHTLWRHPDFLKLWSAQAVSTFCARITREGIPLAAVLTIDASPIDLGILAALSQGPSLLVAMLSGGFVDRSSRRAILIAMDLFRTLILLSVPLAAWFHVLAMPQLYLVAAVAGAASTLFDIADHAYLPALIGRGQLIEGNTKLNVTESIAEIGGPALAGILVQALTAPLAIAIDAASYFVSAILLATIRSSERHLSSREPRRPWHEGFRKGLSVILAEPLLRPLFWMALCSPFFSAFFSSLYVLWAIRYLGLSPALMGITIAVGGGGSLLGALIARPALNALGAGRAIVVCYSISAASAFFVPLAQGPLEWRVASLMIAQAFGDSFAVAAIVLATTLRQSIVPAAVMGRVASVFRAAQGAPAIAGAIVGGVLAASMGPRGALLVSATGILSCQLFGYLSPLWRLGEMPVAPQASPG